MHVRFALVPVAILLALPAFGAEPAPAPPLELPTTAAEACDGGRIEQWRHTQPARTFEQLAVLDRAVQLALLTERQGTHTLDTEGNLSVWAGAAAAGLGLLMLILGAFSRYRRSATAVGAVLVALGGGVFVRAAHQRSRAYEELHRLADCRADLENTRSQLVQNRMGRCLHDLGEVDEDLLGWTIGLRSGAAVKMEQIEKMREELRAAVR